MRATVLQLQEEYDNYTTHHKITKTREQRNVMARFAFIGSGTGFVHNA